MCTGLEKMLRSFTDLSNFSVDSEQRPILSAHDTHGPGGAISMTQVVQSFPASSLPGSLLSYSSLLSPPPPPTSQTDTGYATWLTSSGKHTVRKHGGHSLDELGH